MIRVDLHCHSILSDGFHSPDALADLMAKAGVRHAALTDHDTLDGLARFRKALAERGIAFLTGVEITAEAPDEPLHLLAYGFDPSDPTMRKMLLMIRRQYFVTPTMMLQSLADFCKGVLQRDGQTTAFSKHPGVEEIATIVHNAGGLLFLAHPLVLHSELPRLEEAVAGLKQQGLDGIEAIYGPYDETTRADLLSLADNNRLLVSFGTDFHGGPVFPHLDSVGIDVEEHRWEAFRGAFGESVSC